VEIFARDGQFQQAMSRIRARMMTLGTQLRQAGTSMTVGGTAMGAPFIFAARTAAAFSLEMARVRANTGATDQQFASLNAAAKGMAVQFGRAPEEVAGAMSELAKAGLDAEGVMKSISPILAVAAADNMELARAVEVAVSTMAQFGMTTNDFGTIADKLQATANASTTSVDSIGEALSFVGPKAQEAGQSFDDVAAAIATLADAGLRGSLGGTGLARVIESIANEEGKIAALGVSTRDAAGGMRPFIDVLEDLGKQTANMSNVDKIRLFTDIFEIRGANAALSLSTMRDKFNDVLGTIQNSGGTALNKATAVMSSFGGAVKQLGAQFGVLQIQVIESMGPIATQAVQAFTRLLAVVGEFISRNGTLVAIVAGSVAAMFALGVASLAAGIALQGLATGLRVIQAVLPLIPALFSPIGLAIAAMGAAIAGGVVIARTLSPAFREETDAIAAALMRLDFGAAWAVMNINLSIALVQMHQKFAQAFDLVKNTVIAASQFIGDMLIQGLDRFMGIFGADILTLQSGFEKLGVYFRAAFDWNFAVNGMSAALKKVEDRIDEARQRAPTADARADQRKQQRDRDAKSRDDENKRRDAAFAGTIEELRKDAARARERAFGKADKPAEAKVDVKVAPVKPKVPAAPPGAFMPPPEKKGEKTDSGISSAGNWSGIGLAIGPELGKLEDPAQRTADATERTAEAVNRLADRGKTVSGDVKGDRSKLQGRADALMQDISSLGFKAMGGNKKAAAEQQKKMEELSAVQSDIAAFDAYKGRQVGVADAPRAPVMAPGDFQAGLDAVAAAAADPNVTAEQLLAMHGGGAPAMPQPIGGPPAVAMDVVAPRAAAGQQAAAQGMQAATETSQIGVVFKQVGSEIVAAVNAGTEVSKSMLGVLNKIAEKKAPEFAFQ
jgi:TP901 family phage tail tape measure protein